MEPIEDDEENGTREMWDALRFKERVGKINYLQNPEALVEATE